MFFWLCNCGARVGFSSKGIPMPCLNSNCFKESQLVNANKDYKYTIGTPRLPRREVKRKFVFSEECLKRKKRAAIRLVEITKEITDLRTKPFDEHAEPAYGNYLSLEEDHLIVYDLYSEYDV